ncbi:uncharacterized protein LOC117122835 [Anneissia japonica]|uniref:uncharacterized protein LOC117122835 n=1 Tax=Anneissia japonica TaxID=1529436 RepID=UPI001425627E|nr:uncharacterized protein LOC117122835 [Anneissia japonica]
MEEVEKIGKLYKTQLQQYKDKWSLILDLENSTILEDDNKTIKQFTEKLKRNKVHGALKALGEDYGTDLSLPKILLPCNSKLYILISTLAFVCIGVCIGYLCSYLSSPTKSHKMDESIPGLSQDAVVRKYFLEKQKDLYKNKTLITPPNWNEGHYIDIAQVFTDLVLLKSERGGEEELYDIGRYEKKGKSTSLTQLLKIMKSTNPCRVLITGEAGMGKTTLLRYIAYNWASNSDDTFAGKLLFIIYVKDIKAGDEGVLDAIVRDISIGEFSAKTGLQNAQQTIKNFLWKYDFEIVFLLDGLDELQSGAKGPERLFNGQEFKSSTVILTSRPENTIIFRKECDVHVRVNGFSPTNIKQYIQNYFNFYKQPEMGTSLISEFNLDSDYKDMWGRSMWGRGHEESFNLCSSPLLLLNICTIWQRTKNIPTDLTDIFREVLLTILNQYIDKKNEKKVIYFNSIPTEYSRAILALGRTIYEGLKTNNTVYVDKNALKTYVKKTELVDLALKLGFVYKRELVHQKDYSEIYETPHRLLSEALAGFYLSDKCNQGSLDGKESESIRSNNYLHKTRVFAIGFLDGNAGELMKHWLVKNAANYYSLAKYFKYVKSEEAVIKAIDKHMPTEMKVHVDSLTESFRGFFLYSRNGKDGIPKYEKKHLVQLMRTLCDRYEQNHLTVIDDIKDIIDTSNEQQSENTCRVVAHLSLILQILKHDLFLNESYDVYIPESVEKWGDAAINIFSKEWEEHHLNNEIHAFIFSYVDLSGISGAHLFEILKMAPKLKVLEMSGCNLSGEFFNTIITQLKNTESKVLLELEQFDISFNNLADINGTLFGDLLKRLKNLKVLDMSDCELSGTAVSSMLNEYNWNGEILQRFVLRANDLSNIDGQSLANLLNTIKSTTLRWKDYSLSAENIQDLVTSSNEDIRFRFEIVDLRYTNLSSVSGSTIANFINRFPNLTYIDMSKCSITGTFVRDMLSKCYEDYKHQSSKKKGLAHAIAHDNMNKLNRHINDLPIRIKFILRNNDLSDIDDGKSFVNLLYIMYNVLYDPSKLRWSDYNLSVDHLHYLVNSSDESDIFTWTGVDLSGTNLSSISGSALAKFIEKFPNLSVLSMKKCSLSDTIVDAMINECCKMGILKGKKISLKGNEISEQIHELLLSRDCPTKTTVYYSIYIEYKYFIILCIVLLCTTLLTLLPLRRVII